MPLPAPWRSTRPPVRALRGWTVAAVWLAAVAATPPGPPAAIPAHHVSSRMSMGSLYTIELYGADASELQRVAERALDEVDRLDRMMSHYRRDSTLSRVNREAASAPVAVEPELFEVIAESLRYSRDSGGAFDITVGPLMKAWGLFRDDGRVPAEEELARARGRVDYRHVIANAADRTIRFTRPGVELDLGGIGKGYAVDRVVAILKDHDIPAALVSAGGSTIYALGAPPDRDGWPLHVQDPLDAGRTAITLHVRDRALSISGSSETFFERAGVRYSHVMDPRSGQPVRHVLGVAVLAPTGVAGDALDNALFVAGVREGPALLQRYPDTEAIFFIPQGLSGWTMLRAGG